MLLVSDMKGIHLMDYTKLMKNTMRFVQLFGLISAWAIREKR